ncbi:MAG TPA: regulator, partial [Firmicutes bacterium]|nr:regulator [Bacillota bacterium]
QTKQAMTNISHILAEAGSSISGIIKITAYLKDMNDFPLFNSIYSEFMGEHSPARACVGVASLPRNALIEIEAIALAS